MQLIKGSLRRVFARSELRLHVIKKSIIIHFNPKRTRVKTWCMCPKCLHPTPISSMVVDHISPIIGLTESLYDLDWNTLINRLWCDESNLMAICEACHKIKTTLEAKLRRRKKE